MVFVFRANVVTFKFDNCKMKILKKLLIIKYKSTLNVKTFEIDTMWNCGKANSVRKNYLHISSYKS